MSHTFDIDALRDLGLGDANITETEEFAWPVKPASEGAPAGIVAVSLLELWSLSPAQFRTVNLRLAQEHTLHLEADVANRGVLRFAAPPNVQVADIRGLAPPEYQFDLSDRGIVTLDMRRASKAAAVLTDGRVVGFSVGESGAGLGLGHLGEVLAPDVASWCDRVQDSWLKEYLAPYVATGNLWHFAVAASLFVRLRAYSSAQAQEAVARLLRGEADTELVMAHEWMSRLNPQHRKRVGHYALAEINALECGLEDVERLADAGAVGQAIGLTEIAVRRDDLEAVKTLFSTTDTFEDVQAGLELVDILGARTVASLPVRVSIDQPRLRRMRDADPAAWWLRLAAT